MIYKHKYREISWFMPFDKGNEINSVELMYFIFKMKSMLFKKVLNYKCFFQRDFKSQIDFQSYSFNYEAPNLMQKNILNIVHYIYECVDLSLNIHS